jgi:hypothetical protein
MMRIALAVAIAALAWLPAALPAHANGNPVSVVLSYLNGVSNWGPTDATGVADLVLREGDVKVTVTGLPQLTNQKYVVWLTRSGASDVYMLGAFTTGADKAGRLNLTLPEAVPDKGWDTVLITVEASAGQPTAPGQQRSIAGRFPTPAQSGNTNAIPTRPPQLPSTGGTPPEAAPVTVPAARVADSRVSPAIYFGAAGLLALGAMALALVRRGRSADTPPTPPTTTGRESQPHRGRRGKR